MTLTIIIVYLLMYTSIGQILQNSVSYFVRLNLIFQS